MVLFMLKKEEDDTIRLIGVTANCGNDTLGIQACDGLLQTLRDEHRLADVIIINCQEAHFEKTLAQLQQRVLHGEPIAIHNAGLMTTYTKVNTLFGGTGMTTIVLSRTDKIRRVELVPEQSQIEVRGKNSNKGGYLNTFRLTTANNNHYTIRSASGHLDSESEINRMQDWRNIQMFNAIDAHSWNELAEKVPSIQVCGYDANTRDLLVSGESDPQTGRLWSNKNRVDGRIAPLIQSPLGDQLYSSDNTYKAKETRTLGIREDKKREGCLMAGTLDFVAITNATSSSSPLLSETTRHYHQGRVYDEEDQTQRDHSVVVAQPVTLQSVSDFNRVKNYIIKTLKSTAPMLTSEISELEDTPTNRDTLLKIHQTYLSPSGLLIANIRLVEDLLHVEPWFKNDSLACLNLDWSHLNLLPLQTAFIDPKKREQFSVRQMVEVATNNYSKIVKFAITNPDQDSINNIMLYKQKLDNTLTDLRRTTKDPKKIATLDRFCNEVNLFHKKMSKTINLELVTNEYTSMGISPARL